METILFLLLSLSNKKYKDTLRLVSTFKFSFIDLKKNFKKQLNKKTSPFEVAGSFRYLIPSTIFQTLKDKYFKGLGTQHILNFALLAREYPEPTVGEGPDRETFHFSVSMLIQYFSTTASKV